MTLDELERQGYIIRLSIDTRKVKDALSLSQRDMTTAKNLLETDSD